MLNFFQDHKAEVNKLEAQLNEISNGNQQKPPKSSFFRPEVIIPLGLVLVAGVALTALIIIRNRKIKLAKVKK